MATTSLLTSLLNNNLSTPIYMGANVKGFDSIHDAIHCCVMEAINDCKEKNSKDTQSYEDFRHLITALQRAQDYVSFLAGLIPNGNLWYYTGTDGKYVFFKGRNVKESEIRKRMRRIVRRAILFSRILGY